MGYSQSALAIGLVAGPIAGSFLYDRGGYWEVMFALSIMMIIATIFAAVMIEKDEANHPEEDNNLKEPLLGNVSDLDEEEDEPEIQLNYWDLLSIKVRNQFE